MRIIFFLSSILRKYIESMPEIIPESMVREMYIIYYFLLCIFLKAAIPTQKPIIVSHIFL